MKMKKNIQKGGGRDIQPEEFKNTNVTLEQVGGILYLLFTESKQIAEKCNLKTKNSAGVGNGKSQMDKVLCTLKDIKCKIVIGIIVFVVIFSLCPFLPPNLLYLLLIAMILGATKFVYNQVPYCRGKKLCEHAEVSVPYKNGQYDLEHNGPVSPNTRCKQDIYHDRPTNWFIREPEFSENIKKAFWHKFTFFIYYVVALFFNFLIIIVAFKIFKNSILKNMVSPSEPNVSQLNAPGGLKKQFNNLKDAIKTIFKISNFEYGDRIPIRSIVTLFMNLLSNKVLPQVPDEKIPIIDPTNPDCNKLQSSINSLTSKAEAQLQQRQ